MDQNGFVITTKTIDHNKCIRYTSENSTTTYHVKSSTIKKKVQQIHEGIKEDEIKARKASLAIKDPEPSINKEKSSTQDKANKKAISVDSEVDNKHRYFVKVLICKVCNTEVWGNRCDSCHNICHFCLSKGHKKSNCNQTGRDRKKHPNVNVNNRHKLSIGKSINDRSVLLYTNNRERNNMKCYNCNAYGHFNCLLSHDKVKREVFDELRINLDNKKRTKKKVEKGIKKLKPKIKDIVLNHYEKLVESAICKNNPVNVTFNEKKEINKTKKRNYVIEEPKRLNDKTKARTLDTLFDIEAKLRSTEILSFINDVEIRIQLLQINDILNGLLKTNRIDSNKEDIKEQFMEEIIYKEVIGQKITTEIINEHDTQLILVQGNKTVINNSKFLDSKADAIANIDNVLEELSSTSEYDPIDEIIQLKNKLTAVNHIPKDLPAPHRQIEKDVPKPKWKKNQPYHKKTKYEKAKYNNDDIAFNIDIHHKQVKQYYKKMNRGVSYKTLNLLTKNNRKSEKFILSSEDFINAYKNLDGSITCLYSSKLLSKDTSSIAKFNKEHCVAKYFTIKKNYEFEEDLHHIFPALEEINSLRDKRMLYCPFYLKSQKKCYCSQFSVYLEEPDVNNNLIVKRFSELTTTTEIENFRQECANNQHKLQSDSNASDQQKPTVRGESISKKDIIVFSKKTPWGYLYNGNPGYFCNHRNIGPISRMTLYVLLKYRKVIDKMRFYEKAVEFYRFMARNYPVEEWELRKNFIVQQIQGDRNVFIDHPEWVDSVDFDLAFD